MKKNYGVLRSPNLENINKVTKEKLASEASQENFGKIAFFKTTNREQIGI